MAYISITISGESHEVTKIVQSLAYGHSESKITSFGSDNTIFDLGAESTRLPISTSPQFRWTSDVARETTKSVSHEAQRLLAALLNAPNHQLHIDDIYQDLELDRHRLIGVRRSISAALRRNPLIQNAPLLSTRDRRISLDRGYALAMQSQDKPDAMLI